MADNENFLEGVDVLAVEDNIAEAMEDSSDEEEKEKEKKKGKEKEESEDS